MRYVARRGGLAVQSYCWLGGYCAAASGIRELALRRRGLRFKRKERAVPTLPNGLGIEDLVEGEGEECPKGATITIHYRGTLMSGKEFDSTTGGEPATFPLRRLIVGWQEGIPGMKPGGKRKLTIPWAMGYGAAGSPPDIPAKADLIFEIELISFR